MFDEDNSNQEDSFQKPSFDGRLEYYKVLKQYMLNIAMASASSDFNMWLRMIRGMFSMVKPFIRESDATKIKDKIMDVKVKINSIERKPRQSQMIINSMVDNDLQDITEDIYFYSKHLLLPTSNEDDTDFNENDFLRGSDL